MEPQFLTELLTVFENPEDEIYNYLGVGKPQNLYHYTTSYGLRGILETQSLWATDYRFLNDKDELSYGFKVIRDFASKHMDSFEFIGTGVELGLDINFDALNKMPPHVISFCKEGDLLSQWRAYGNDALGYCLEFELNNLQLLSGDSNECWPIPGHIVPVIYNSKTQERVTNEFFLMIERIYQKHKEEINHGMGYQISFASNVLSFFHLLAACFKQQGFFEEKEYRAVFMPTKEKLDRVVKTRISNEAFIPYLEACFYESNSGDIRKLQCLPVKKIILPPGSGDVSKIGLKVFIETLGHDREIELTASSVPLRKNSALHW